MRVAVIDHAFLEPNGHALLLEHFLFSKFKERGVEDICCSHELRDFERRYGSLRSFDVLLLHPEVEDRGKVIKEIPQLYPDLRVILYTRGLIETGSYTLIRGLRIYDCDNGKEIVDYAFEGKS